VSKLDAQYPGHRISVFDEQALRVTRNKVGLGSGDLYREAPNGGAQISGLGSPGKFEGEPAYVEMLWNLANDGGADFDDGPLVAFKIEKDLIKEFPELAGSAGQYVVLEETDSGFVNSAIMSKRYLDKLVEAGDDINALNFEDELSALGAYTTKSGKRATVSEAKAMQSAQMAENWWSRAQSARGMSDYDANGHPKSDAKLGDLWATTAKQCLAAAFYMAHVTGGGDYVYADQLLSQAEHAASQAAKFGTTADGKRSLKWYMKHYLDTKKLVEALDTSRTG
jgi:hypothetical protein